MLVAIALTQHHNVNPSLKDLFVPEHHFMEAFVENDAGMFMPPEWFEVGSQHSLTRQHQRFRNAEQLARIPCFPHATRAVQNKKWEASSDQAVIVEKLHPSKD
jgi:hypothetical protein